MDTATILKFSEESKIKAAHIPRGGRFNY